MQQLKKIFTIALLTCALTPASAANLLSNGNFENGLNGWVRLVANDGGEATFTADTDAAEGAASMKTEVTTLGTKNWSIQAISSDWAAETDRDYTITFWAKAATENSLFRILIQDQSYGNQLSKDQSLTTEWVQYSWPVSPGNTSMDFVIHFIQTGIFWIDDIRINDGEVVLPAAILTLNPSTRHQTMVGFGGALTWYADRVFRSAQTEEINQLLFEDLGLDIIRFQNWYFPTDYPNNKETAGMPDETIWNNTAQFFQLAKAANPDIQILLSSWGPPAALKSNNDRSGGTLKKVDGEFVYDEYAEYWVDTFDYLQFTPDYLSIQNEPGYTATWTTCEWRPTETADFPGYDTAIDAVHNVLKDRATVPQFIGAEVENIGHTSWDNSLSIFREFTTPLKSRDYVTAYAYHLYNIWNLGKIDTVIPDMNLIRDEFSEKPNFMTEYSREFAGWLETARIIQNTLIEANTSAYIHWNMIWAPADNADEESAMISITYNGAYEVEENYYALKHFSKFIDIGYIRIDLQGSDSTLRVSAFLRPDGRQLVIQAVNAASEERSVDWVLGEADIASAKVVRSTEGQFFADLGTVDMEEESNLPAKSLSTYIVELNSSLGPALEPVSLVAKSFDLGTDSVSLTVGNQDGATFTLWSSSDLINWIQVSDAVIVPGDTTTALTDPSSDTFPVFYQVRGGY